MSYIPFTFENPCLECVDFAGGPGAKAQDESALSSLCNKVNCAARENALGCVQRPSVKDACYQREILERGIYTAVHRSGSPRFLYLPHPYSRPCAAALL